MCKEFTNDSWSVFIVLDKAESRLPRISIQSEASLSDPAAPSTHYVVLSFPSHLRPSAYRAHLTIWGSVISERSDSFPTKFQTYPSSNFPINFQTQQLTNLQNTVLVPLVGTPGIEYAIVSGSYSTEIEYPKGFRAIPEGWEDEPGVSRISRSIIILITC